MEYEGKDNLDVMSEAHVYNGYLLNNLKKSIDEPQMKILDFGAGKGEFADKVKFAFPACNIMALEPDETLLQCSSQVVAKVSLDEIDDDSLDLIYSFNVLEHIEKDTEILTQLYDKLVQDGKLVLYVPAFPCLYSEMDKKVGHWRRYTKSELIAKVQQAGFRVVACRYMDGIGWFASWLYKFNKNSQGNVNPRLLKIYDKWVMPLSILWDKLTLGSFLGKNIWLEAQK